MALVPGCLGWHIDTHIDMCLHDIRYKMLIMDKYSEYAQYKI